MPRLTVFLPAEKVVIDTQENTTAIFGVMTGVYLGVPPESPPLPEGSGVPIRWYVLSIWRQQPGDEGLHFTQRVQILSPSQRVLFEGLLDFDIPKVTHRNKMEVIGFPVAEAGEYTLKLSIRSGEEQWHDAAEYPLSVSYVGPHQEAR